MIRHSGFEIHAYPDHDGAYLSITCVDHPSWAYYPEHSWTELPQILKVCDQHWDEAHVHASSTTG